MAAKNNHLKGKRLIEVTWEEVEYDTATLSRIIKANMKPDAIVCIGRGAWIYSRLLSSLLKIPVGTILTRHYEGPEKEVKFFMERKVLSYHPIEGNIVLVDDVVNTGKTLMEVHKFLKKNKKIKQLKTAVLFYNKEGSKFIPDMYVKTIKNNDWIVFPYEKEAYRGVQL